MIGGDVPLKRIASLLSDIVWNASARVSEMICDKSETVKNYNL